eukprot:CAMPEP_0175138400 /NCGR_PEP_ID=MMETSP0087-20121206/10330_1 /TAXON_ID=136419 /ORGANISM="Unknown Unknown, Strain D1" /LENGTH=944 /DNA_ID=CAMNT_0016421303 /DNA_START=72 /DNA_END=2906 /DNA_ORIENTATION=+
MVTYDLSAFQIEVLENIVSVSSVAAVCGTLYVIQDIVANFRPLKLRIKLVLMLSVFDMLSALMFFIGVYSLQRSDHGIHYGPIEDQTEPSSVCKSQAFFVQLFNLASVFWSVCMCHNLVLWLGKGKHERELNKFFKLYISATLFLSVGLSILVAVLDKLGSADIVCWIKKSSWRFTGFFLYVILGLAANIVSFTAVRAALSRRSGAGGVESRDAQMIRLKFQQYIVVFICVWFFHGGKQVYEMTMDKPTFIGNLLEGIFVPGRGFINAVLYSSMLEPLMDKLCIKKEKKEVEPEEEEKKLRSPLDKNASIWIGTWNVGEQNCCLSDIQLWIPLGLDMYAIGCQETLSPNGFEALVKEHLEKGTTDDKQGKKKKRTPYTVFSCKIGSDKVDLGYHGYIIVFLYVKTQHINDKTFVLNNSDCTLKRGTKVGGMMLANKGASAISCLFYQTTFAFATCHMRSDKNGANRFHQRNKDAQAIVRDLNVDIDDMQFDFPDTHHHVFLFGDFNYRVLLTAQQCIPKLSDAMLTMGTKQWMDLISWDELNIARLQGKVLHDFWEAPIRFPPTFRRHEGPQGVCRDFSDPRSIHSAYSTTVTEKDGTQTFRTPSWTDRILWHSMDDLRNNVVLKEYAMLESVELSDHKPVYARFDVRCCYVPKHLDYMSRWEVVLTDIAFEEAPSRELPWTAEDFATDVCLTSPNKAIHSATFDAMPPPKPFVQRLDEVEEVVVQFPLLSEDKFASKRKVEAVAAAMRGVNVEEAQNLHTIPWEDLQATNSLRVEGHGVYHRGMHLLIKFIGKEEIQDASDNSADEDIVEIAAKKIKKRETKKAKKAAKKTARKKKYGLAIDKMPNKSMCQAVVCLSGTKQLRAPAPFRAVLTTGGVEVGLVKGLMRIKKLLNQEEIDRMHVDLDDTRELIKKLQAENEELKAEVDEMRDINNDDVAMAVDDY